MPFNAFSFTAPPKKPHIPTSSTPHPHPLHPHPSTYLSNPSSYNPWNPQTPSYHLYRSFKSFTSAENAARLQRGEQPFATAAGRDRAFDKLMRLSRGEEEIGWRIEEGGWDGESDGGIVDWGGVLGMQERGVGRCGLGNGNGDGEWEEEMSRAVGEGDKDKDKDKDKERKDSKEVCHASGLENMRIDGKDAVGEEDGFVDADMSPEHREDIGDEDDGLEDMAIF